MKLEKFFKAVSVLTTSLFLITAIYIQRGFYSDGSQFFIQGLVESSVADDGNHIRLLVNALNFSPFYFFKFLNLGSYEFLKWMFSFGLFLVPVFILTWCYSLSVRANDKRLFYVCMLSTVTAVFPSSIFILNQSITTVCLVWLILHYVFLDLKLKTYDNCILSFVAVVLFRSHEGMIFLGPLISICCFISSLQKPKRRLLLTIGVLGILWGLFVLYWQLTHPVAKQTKEFLELLEFLKPRAMWKGTTRISILTTILALMILFIKSTKPYIHKFIQISLCIGIIVIFNKSLRFLFGFTSPNPYTEYLYRVLIPFGTAFWVMLYSFIHYKKFLFKMDAIKALVYLSLTSVSIWQLGNNIHWARFVTSSKSVMANGKSKILDPAAVGESLRTTGSYDSFSYWWGWTWPVYSLSLSDTPKITKIFKPEEKDKYLKINSDSLEIPYVTLHREGYFNIDRILTLE